jgi:anti-sigma regulatory factor (Ser/Thr protein kinase)
MNTEPTTTEFTIDFPISPAWFQTIRRVISTASIQCGFSDRDAGQISMAVDEAMANVHKHGYQFDESGRVTLQVTTHMKPKARIDIQLDDETQNIDLDSIRSRDLADIRPGGLGVHLIQTIMDESSWSIKESGGIRLQLSKTIRIVRKQKL